MGHFVLEVKRVIVDPAAWPRAATRLVAGLEQMAAVAGARRVTLQTGGEQPEAKALYPKIGYRYTRGYSPYDTATSQSVCFEKHPEA